MFVFKCLTNKQNKPILFLVILNLPTLVIIDHTVSMVATNYRIDSNRLLV